MGSKITFSRLKTVFEKSKKWLLTVFKSKFVQTIFVVTLYGLMLDAMLFLLFDYSFNVKKIFGIGLLFWFIRFELVQLIKEVRS